MRKNDGSLAHHVYRKRTHNEKYLHASSHSVPSQKIGILKTLATSAVWIADNGHLDKELNHLHIFLQSNGYNTWDINRAFKKYLENNIQEPVDKDESIGVIF